MSCAELMDGTLITPDMIHHPPHYGAHPSALTVIGVDPGPVPGFVRLRYLDGELKPVATQVVQCSANAVLGVFNALLDTNPYAVQIERFVDSSRSGRSRNRADLDATREVVAIATAQSNSRGVPVSLRRAVDVKPWATDERLDAAGLLEATKGMRHARDAARHALFLACQLGMPDPLSTKGR